MLLAQHNKVGVDVQERVELLKRKSPILINIIRVFNKKDLDLSLVLILKFRF